VAKTYKSIKELSAAHKTVGRNIDRATRTGIDRGLAWTIRYIKSHFFRRSGEPGPGYIVSRSGRLIGSIRATRAKNVGRAGRIYGSLQMGGQWIAYAAILEYGGRTRPHMIYPKKASVLHFITKGGEEVFTKRVRHPGSVIEPRAVLGRGMARGTPQMMKMVAQEHRKAIRKSYK